MKKIIKISVLTSSLALILFFTLLSSFDISNNSTNNLSLEKLMVNSIANAEDGSGNVCYSVTSVCYIWGCSYVTHCGGCIAVKVDDWNTPGTCL